MTGVSRITWQKAPHVQTPSAGAQHYDTQGRRPQTAVLFSLKAMSRHTCVHKEQGWGTREGALTQRHGRTYMNISVCLKKKKKHAHRPSTPIPPQIPTLSRSPGSDAASRP